MVMIPTLQAHELTVIFPIFIEGMNDIIKVRVLLPAGKHCCDVEKVFAIRGDTLYLIRNNQHLPAIP